jgi:hypothetical protein
LSTGETKFEAGQSHQEYERNRAVFQLLINATLFAGPLLGRFFIANVMTIPAGLLLPAGLHTVPASMIR